MLRFQTDEQKARHQSTTGARQTGKSEEKKLFFKIVDATMFLQSTEKGQGRKKLKKKISFSLKGKKIEATFLSFRK